jgi:hypothetical protein
LSTWKAAPKADKKRDVSRRFQYPRAMRGLARATMALLQLGLISCMTTLAEDFGDSNDRWRIWVDEVKTGGAQSYASDQVTTYGSVRYDPEDDLWPREEETPLTPIEWSGYKPLSGQQFVHVIMKIRNLTAEPQTFDLTAIRLSVGKYERTPVLLDMGREINKPAAPQPELKPGEEIARLLIFSFPKEIEPNRLSVEGMTLAFPIAVGGD